jgi:hypothetical protein
MTQKKWSSNKESDKERHATDELFTEWPTPSDVVEGFGGDPNKAANRQWTAKKRTPDQ